MPDLLTHVLLIYIILQLSAWRVEWLDRPEIVMGMAGTLIPDAVKIGLLLPGHQITTWIGLPFSWFPLARFGGAITIAVIASLLVEADYRRRAFLLLNAGLMVHLISDALINDPTPYTYDILYPFTSYRFPWLDFDLYLSSDVWPVVVTGACAILVFWLSRSLHSDEDW